MQPGDLLVREPSAVVEVVEPRPPHRDRGRSRCPRLAEPHLAVADGVRAAGVGGERGVGTVDEDVSVVAGPRAVRSPDGRADATPCRASSARVMIRTSTVVDRCQRSRRAPYSW